MPAVWMDSLFVLCRHGEHRVTDALQSRLFQPLEVSSFLFKAEYMHSRRNNRVIRVEQLGTSLPFHQSTTLEMIAPLVVAGRHNRCVVSVCLANAAGGS